MHTGETQTPGGRAGRRHDGGPQPSAGAAGLPGPAVQDRHAGTAERPHDRLRPDAGTARRRRSAAVLVSDRQVAGRAAALLDHVHERTSPRVDPGESAPRADVQRPNPQLGPSLLPVDRRQGRAVRGQIAASAVPGAGRTQHARGVRQRSADQPAARRPGPDVPPDSRLPAGADHALRLCGRIRLLPAGPVAADAGDETRRRTVLRRADQRHDGLRGSRRAGPDRRRQRRAETPGAASR